MTLAIAHRGDPLRFCENTIPSFRSAVELGADMVEIDCRATADGRVAVVHDPTLSRLWGLDRPVAALTWREVAALGDPTARVPQLPEVLAEVEVPLMVDLPDPDAVEGVLRDVDHAGASARCLFVGALESLRRVRRLDGRARIGLTWDLAAPPGAQLLSELRIEAFNPYWRLATAGVVAGEHAAGRWVSVWTVDDPRDMVACLSLGVDAIVTNDVAAFLELRRAVPTALGAGRGDGGDAGGERPGDAGRPSPAAP